MSSEDISDISTFILNQIKSIAAKLDFINFTIQKQSVSNHGDGFIGSLSGYKILGHRRVSNRELISDNISLICKTLPINEYRLRMFSTIDLFEREIYFYNKVQPILENFQKERLTQYDEDAFVAYPKCYVARQVDNQFIIILDDLKTSSYQMWDRNERLSIEAVTIIMKELGKFHALSFALRDQQPHIMDELTVEMNDMILIMLNGCYGRLTEKAFNVAVENVDNPDALSVISELRTTHVQYMKQILSYNAAGVFGVIGHGDFYKNNILFRFEESIVERVNFLDWQLCRIGSPALDISYFLMTSTDSNIRQHYDQLLQTYYDSLETHLSKLGSDPKKLFTFDDLINQMKQFGKYGVVFLPFLLQITLSKPEDFIDVDSIESDEQMLSIIKINGETKEVLKN